MVILDCKNEFPRDIKLAVVVSRFNEEVTSKLLHGCLERLKERDVTKVTVAWVPGAVEIPLVCQRFAEKKVDVVIALGAVIRGETTHYEAVCDTVNDGCREVMLATRVPIIFGVLTVENDEQAMARVGGPHGHKGKDAADAALEMIALLRKIDSVSATF